VLRAAAPPSVTTIKLTIATNERHTDHGIAVVEPRDRGRRCFSDQGSSGRSGAHADPLMWLPPSTKSVLPVR
jgi:hypothetical protein